MKVARTLEEEKILQNVEVRGEQLRRKLRAIAGMYPHLFAEVRGWGLINGMELQKDVGITAIDIVKAAMKEGLLLVPAGGQVLRFVPPLIVSASEVEAAGEMLEKAIQ